MAGIHSERGKGGGRPGFLPRMLRTITRQMILTAARINTPPLAFSGIDAVQSPPPLFTLPDVFPCPPFFSPSPKSFLALRYGARTSKCSSPHGDLDFSSTSADNEASPRPLSPMGPNSRRICRAASDIPKLPACWLEPAIYPPRTGMRSEGTILECALICHPFAWDTPPCGAAGQS